MTIDTRDVNDFGPGKFRTSADNNLGKYCYFNRSNTDSRFRCYLARHNNSKPDKLVFLIDERNCSIDFSNKSSDFVLTRSQSNGTPIGAGKSSDKENYSNGRPEVDEGRTRDRPWTQPSQPFPEEEEDGYCSNSEETIQKEIKEIGTQTEKSSDFFPTEKSITKRKKVRYTATKIKYSPTRVKSRNFLSNISYNSINKADFYNENLILDVFILLVKNLNLFSLQRKILDKFKHEMIYMLWRECVRPAFYRRKF